MVAPVTRSASRPVAILSLAMIPLLAACGHGSSSGKPTSLTPGTTRTGPNLPTVTAPATTAPAMTAPVTTRSAASSSPTTTSGGRGTHCRTADLDLALRGTRGGAGHGGYVITFTNRGAASCVLGGYPGVDGQDSSGRTMVHAKRNPRGYLGGADPSEQVRLRPGEAASALLEGVNGATPNGGPCPTIPMLLVTPPNETDSKQLQLPLSLCYPEIHPVTEGTSGGAAGTGNTS